MLSEHARNASEGGASVRRRSTDEYLGIQTEASRRPTGSGASTMSPPPHNRHVTGQPPNSSRFSRRIEDYEIGEVIGRGGFAVVHQAVSKYSTSYGEEVAVKIIDKVLIAKSNLMERVAMEISIHSSVNHPSIVQLYTHFQTTTHVYLVTELCRNGELYRYIQRRNGGCLSEAEARGALEEIVKGVLYLHAHGIIHRDLKLSNVLITSDYHVSQAVKSTLDKVSRVEYYLPDSVSDDARDLIGRLLMKPKASVEE
ncbi:Serine/threonine-protein kinase plk4 [Entophlyctis luteolus]|nr:Serine/threonine-protein kinase plk4 [Entophlyctis luteolus]